MHLPLLLLPTTIRGEDQLQLARLCHMQICGPVLVTKCMPGTSLEGQKGFSHKSDASGGGSKEGGGGEGGGARGLCKQVGLFKPITWTCLVFTN